MVPLGGEVEALKHGGVGSMEEWANAPSESAPRHANALPENFIPRFLPLQVKGFEPSTPSCW